MAGDSLFGLPAAEHPDGCDGRGWSTTPGADGRLTSGRCPGCERDRVLAALTRFVPPRFRAAIDIPDPVAAWADRGRDAQGLYLAGPVGSGKTHTAYMAAAHWCVATGTVPRDGGQSEEWLGGGHYGPTVVFIRATTLFDELRPGNDGTRQRIVDYQRARLLVLDDLGAEKPSEWTCEKLLELVDERYVQARPTIVTSNLPPNKLSTHVGERVASRLAEMCTVVPVVGQDRRRAR